MYICRIKKIANEPRARRFIDDPTDKRLRVARLSLLLLLFFQSVQLSLLPIDLSLLRLDLLLHSRILVLPLLHLIPDHGAAKEAYRGTDARARSRIARRAADNGA